ncbi:MAG: hypothetical protein COV10_02935 [Candidatus Vogelbacteria bacterium CG10_big_fil_rev_8_21_14_0_10_51_16]|uniref:ATP-grasp domain-containing protein n=1 Tax=Candidatus Vogelbacteria bacterium CG10_big_fil_rev_8_21_14_0_10_51_16 TaxID=1975045 RepID=A0A2H0RFL4_9BACT|nr:MAG: hypothetical protein COV10_02935 [Candidatus Vogelbacteria bacterium CG10_big_fil_rev_8_21_14_0_10_51_16]
MSPPFTSSLIAETARELGIELFLEPKFGYAGRVTYPSGSRRFFHLATMDCNGAAAARIASDKDYTSFFLKSLGYSVPEGEAFFSDQWCLINNTSNNLSAALDYATTIGYPVIVKPNARAQGNGVSLVEDRNFLEQALGELFYDNNIVLVQKVIHGRDYRAIVYKDSAPIFYERTPLSVVGDGNKTVRELLEAKLSHLKKGGRGVKIVPNDTRISNCLTRNYGLDLDSRPRSGQLLRLLDNANLSAGGDAVDLSTEVHQSLRNTAIQIARDAGLTFAGIDIMTKESVTGPISQYTVLEVNDHPGLEHYSAIGKDARNRVKALYRLIIEDME